MPLIPLQDAIIVNNTGNVLQRNIEARSYNHFCSGKAINITYNEYVFVALSIQHATHTRHIVICALPRSTIFLPHYLINGSIFRTKFIEPKMCGLIFSANFVWNISHCKKN